MFNNSSLCLKISVQQTTIIGLMKVIQDLAALYSALLLLTGESGQVCVFMAQKMLTLGSNQNNYADKVTYTAASIAEIAYVYYYGLNCIFL